MNIAVIIGGNHHNTLGLIRSLGEKGITVDVFIHEKDTYIVRKSRYINRLYLISLVSLVKTIVETYREYTEKPVIFCGSDESAAIIDENYDLVSRYFYCFNADGKQGRITEFMNKEVMRHLAEEVGIECPKTLIVSKKKHQPDDIPFPCMIKPINSLDAGKSELNKCCNFRELQVKLSDGLTYQLQEYIEKDFELNLVGCSIMNGNKIVAPGIIRKIREYPYKKGSSSFSVLDDIKKYHYIELDKIQKFIAAIGYEGLFSVEFLCKEDRAYFLEINMRNDGNGYVPTSANCNLPYLWYLYVTKNIIDVQYKVRTPHYFMREFTDIYYVLDGILSIKKWINDIKRTNCFLMYNSKDRVPFYFNLFHVLSAIPSKILKLLFRH